MLFHADVYLPAVLRLSNSSVPVRLIDPDLRGRLTLSYHAELAARTDRYGLIEIPEYFDAKHARLIEIEVDPVLGVTKRVFRQRYNDRFDLVLVILANWKVKTVWLNKRTDVHRTLNAAKYVQPPKAIQ